MIPTLGRASLKEAKASCEPFPVEVEKDTHKTGAGPSRNRAIHRVKTDWVGFLDDDDLFAPDYSKRVSGAITAHPSADVIIFRAQYPDGQLLPKVPKVIWGNCPISFVMKTALAKKYPFVKEENAYEKNEDFVMLKTLEENGHNIVFSPEITYLVKPSKEAQENANINHM